MAITVPVAERTGAPQPPVRPGRVQPVSRAEAAFDRDYWLAHCEGYRVDGREGRIGFVDEIRVLDGLSVLAVRAGLLGRRILHVPADEVAFIVPQEQRIWLRTPARIVGSEHGRADEAGERPRARAHY